MKPARYVLVIGLLALAAASDAAAQVASRIRVTLPHQDAQLFVEGQEVAGTGAVREFTSAPLEAGQVFNQKFTVVWRPNTYTEITRNKVVRFKAGEPVSVDLTQDDPADRARIRYVPTPQEIVDHMIKLAGITPDDVVYEPGCGDARVLITAVKAGARRAVGIDIDPERVTESRANVKTQNLDDRIEIRLADALETDYSPATVVFLYMGNEFNMMLRPILWKHLKVGTRLVSHRFTMGDWAPDNTAYVTDDGELEYQLHLWTITPEIKERLARQGAAMK